MGRFERACCAALLLALCGMLMYSDGIGRGRLARVVASKQSTGVTHTPWGNLLRLSLTSAPFPDIDRENGYQYEDTDYPADLHYADPSVAVLVPHGLVMSGPVNLVFFFHGWNSTIDDEEQRFDLYRQFSESGVQALLVLPELARDAPDSYGGKLEEQGGFARMVDELLKVLRAKGQIRVARAGTIVLAGHSGAYRVIAQILSHGGMEGNIRDVWLFDALYDLTDQYDDWIQRTRGRFVSVSAEDGEETTEVDGLISLLRDEGVPVKVARDDPGTDARTLRARVLFLQSDSDHYGVVFDQDEFRRLLKASPDLLRPSLGT
jgi:hypothetical protein